MASHPLNLLLRFLLELTTWGAAGTCAFEHVQGLWRWPAALGAPFVLMLCWGVFAVPDDPSRGGSPVFVVSGARRLVLEVAEFSVGGWAIYGLGYPLAASLFALLIVLHHALSWDRLTWLLER